PNRFTDGYSFGPHSLDRAESCGAKLVISVDNGTSAHETIEAFVERGVDVVVTDHHEPTPNKELPPALAIVNPKLHESQYPFRELCGGAVAFKLAWGVAQTFEGTDRVSTKLREFLVEAMSYVAIATVCDVVPLVDENRILARWGLKSLATTQHAGLSALLDVSGLGHRRLTGEDVAFKIGPRLNASGRLGTAEAALEVLLCEDSSKAKSLAKRLDDLNEERREIERGVLEEARAAVEALSEEEREPVLVVAGQGWHQGVVGIVAARLVDQYACPSIVLGLDGEEGRGSARSVPGFSVLDAMHGGAEHMIRYGGHEQAAGCEVRADAVDALRKAVCTRATEILAESEGAFSAPPLELDAELPFESLTPEFMKELDRLEPFGPGNESALFLCRDLRLAEPARRVGADKTHLMLRLRRGNHAMRGMAFGLGARADELQMGMPIEAV
ncbi:MAG: single-stranded-DNA-specific exonuclease RecJ, partial [Planctomycetota bacterium]